MGPLIGIPPCLDEQGRFRRGRSYHYLDRAYGDAVAAAGGTPLYLPQQPDPAALAARLDGLLVPGGGDFAPPAPYPDGVEFDPVPDTQLAFDAALLGAALDRELPVLGICYGMQLLVRHHRGTLLYDIATDRPAAGRHRLPEPDGRHPIELTPGTRLAEALAGVEPLVNSLHHQGVDEPGLGLHVAARAADGIAEAVEAPDARFCLGVQWHPEKLRGAQCERLFAAFVAACQS